MKHNIVAKTLLDELTILAEETKKYSNAIKNAKSNLKKEYFTKKLKKKSKEAEKVIFALSRLQQLEETKNKENIERDDNV